jgi:hypothetical protein
MKIKIYLSKIYKILSFLLLFGVLLNGCNGKLPGGDARKFPDDPKLRVKKNLEEGRGFKIGNILENNKNGGVFEFASSNELWRASLDVLDFMPLTSVNYSGGIIISDWYSTEQSSNESIKISIRFLTNEIRSDALDIKVFNKKCNETFVDCKIVSKSGNIVEELKREILKKAIIYKKENEEKDKKNN